MILFQKTI